MIRNAGTSRTIHSDSGRATGTRRPPRRTHFVLFQVMRPRYVSRPRIERTPLMCQPRPGRGDGTVSRLSRAATVARPRPAAISVKIRSTIRAGSGTTTISPSTRR